MNRTTKFAIAGILIILGLIFLGYYWHIYHVRTTDSASITFQIKEGESLYQVTERLEKQGIIKSATLLRKYLAFKNLDKEIHAGLFTVQAPITIARVTEAFDQPSYEEITLTFLPGWNLRDIEDYLIKKEITTSKEFIRSVGKTAARETKRNVFEGELIQSLPDHLSLEGYLAPDTYRFYADDDIDTIIQTLIDHREKQFTEEMIADSKKQGRTIHEILTMASIIEREVRAPEDRKKVSDIFWRRVDAGWGMQADSTVHYLTGKKGDIFTDAEDRKSNSPWNTYKYKGLPPGPISMPSKDSIIAAIYPTPNDDWYFITTFEGDVKYAANLEEHNANVQKYLR